MADPIAAQRSPYPVEIEAGKKYAWCACGRSGNQPFCDGSHADTGLKPVVFTAEDSKQVWLCGCKASGSKPHCDGTHKTL